MSNDGIRELRLLSTRGEKFGDGWETVPAKVKQIAELAGLLDELADEDTEEMYNATREGRCMTCGGDLGETALLLINKLGVGAAYCGGPCLQDLAIMGWLGEQHDDIRDRIEFRGRDA